MRNLARCVFLAGLATVCGPLRAAWVYEDVDTGGDVGRYASLAKDAAGRPCIAYYDETNGDLKYASWNGSSWTVVTVVSTGNVGAYASLAFDPAGRPCIAFYSSGTAMDLSLARFWGSSWTVSAVDTAGNVGMYASLAVSSIGVFHIAYYDATNGDLKYARSVGSGWSISAVDTAGDVGRHCRLALDSQGTAHVVYYDNTNFDLKYARFNGAAWQVETVDGAGGAMVGEASSIAAGADGVIHAAYYDFFNNTVKYARWTGGVWTFNIIEATRTFHTAIVVGPDNHPRVAYQQQPNISNLRYAAWNGSQWSAQTVEAGGYVGEFVSLALDASGAPMMAYYDGATTTRNLRFARWDAIPPAAVSNLTAATVVGQTQLNLSWTAPGDDGTVGALTAGSRFEIKYTTRGMITAANYSAPPQPSYTLTIDTAGVVAGSLRSLVLENLIPGATYWFAIKTRDRAGNWSSWNSSADVPGTNPQAFAWVFKDDTIPQLTGSFPVHNALNVSVHITSVVFRFSEAMSTGVWQLAHSLNYPYAQSTVTWTSPSEMVIQHPSPLAADSVYTFVLNPAGSNPHALFQDLFGNPLVTTTVTFRTADNRPRYSISGQVRDGGGTPMSGVQVRLTGVSTGAVFTPVDGSYSFVNLTSGAYQVTPSMGGYQFSPAFRSTTSLVADAVLWDFTGTGDTTPPSLAGSFPANGQIGVSVGISSVSFRFSEAMAGSWYISPPGGSYSYQGYVWTSQTELVIFHSTPLAESSTFTFTLNPAGTPPGQELKDITGNVLPTTQVTFYTGRFTPQYAIRGAVRDGVGVPMNGVTVSLSGAASAVFMTGTDGVYEFSALSTGAYTVVASKPGFVFMPLMRSTPAISADLSGWDFTGAADTTPPTIVESIPAHSQTNVSVNTSSIVVRFSKAMNGAYNYQFSYNMSISSVFWTSPLEFVLRCSTPLPAYATCTVILNGAGTNPAYLFKDLSGNTLATSTISFMTGPAGTGVYRIRGYVRDGGGNGISGVSMSLSGAQTAAVGTDGAGFYEFTGLGVGMYTVTPVRAGYAFTPVSRTTASISGDILSWDFTGSADTQPPSLVGSHPASGATGVSVFVSSVVFRFSEPMSGGWYLWYTLNYPYGASTKTWVSPTEFALFHPTPLPANSVFQFVLNHGGATNGFKDVSGFDLPVTTVTFTTGGGVPTFSISGYVRDAGGAGVEGVSVHLTGAGTAVFVTTASGFYRFVNITTGTYTVVPSRTGYEFAPAFRQVALLNADINDWHFTATTDTSPPVLVSAYPANGMAGVPIDISSVTFRFSEPMDTSYDLDASPSYPLGQSTITWRSPIELVIRHPYPLPAFTTFTVVLNPPGASAPLRDLAGHSLATTSVTFVTGDAVVGDTIPPAAVTTLAAVAGPLPGSVSLSWISPGDDGMLGSLSGTYAIMYALTAGAAWDPLAAQVVIPAVGVTPGSTRIYTISSLTPGATYHFRLWTQDDFGNWSGISNPASAYAMPVPSVNLPPRVAMVSPPAASAWTVGDSVTLVANAEDPDGMVVTVTFYAGSTALGTVSASPYTFVWTAVPTGVHQVRAVARDDRGEEAVSGEISIVVTGLAVGSGDAAVQGGRRGYLHAGRNESLTVSCRPTAPGELTVQVYSLRGRRVRSLTVNVPSAGLQHIVWRGENDEGLPVGAGVYLITVRGPGVDRRVRVAVLK
jgi:chitodextrinase